MIDAFCHVTPKSYADKISQLDSPRVTLDNPRSVILGKAATAGVVIEVADQLWNVS